MVGDVRRSVLARATFLRMKLPRRGRFEVSLKARGGHLIEVHQLDQDTRQRLPSAAVFWHRTVALTAGIHGTT